MDSQSQSPPASPNPAMVGEGEPTGKKPILIIGLILLLLIIVTGAIYAGIKIAEKKNQSQTLSTIKNLTSPTKAQNIPTAVPTTNPTANWKTYNSNILSFKYPTELILQERQINYFVLLSDSNNPQSVVVSIDARLIGNYVNYEKAISSTKAGLTGIQTQELNNGIKISGKIEPGMGQGQSIIIVLFKYQQGAIEIETTTTDPTQLQLFDQILSTFKFLDSSKASGEQTYSSKIDYLGLTFNFNYPNNWTVEKSNSGGHPNFAAVFSPDKSSCIKITLTSLTASWSLDQVLKEGASNFDASKPDNTVIKSSSLTINGMSAKIREVQRNGINFKDGVISLTQDTRYPDNKVFTYLSSCSMIETDQFDSLIKSINIAPGE